MGFTQFYQDGGVFMHVITLLTLVAGATLLRRAKTIRRTFRDPSEQLARLRDAGTVLPSLVAAIVMVGVLGTGLGFVAIQAALRTVPVDQWPMNASRGLQIAPYPMIWSLALAVPLTLGHGVLRRLEQRLRGLIEKHA